MDTMSPPDLAAAGAPPAADDIKLGIPLPLGAYLNEGGTNLSLFSRHATCVFLEFYGRPASAEPTRRIELTPTDHPWSETVIYELHVRGFTRHPTTGRHIPRTDGSTNMPPNVPE